MTFFYLAEIYHLNNLFNHFNKQKHIIIDIN